MNKIRLLSELSEHKLVAVIRAQSPDEAIKISESVIEGGIKFVEITFTVPQADQVIQTLRDKYKGRDDVFIGAGSCVDAETAHMAIFSGAEFIVSPTLDKEVLKLCNKYRIPSIPGIQTPTEVVEALELGVDVVKLFPSRIQGPSMIKDLKGPIPQVNLMPTGGVGVSNLKEWLEAGAFAVGVGGSLTKPAKIGNYSQIVNNAKELVSIVKGYTHE